MTENTPKYLICDFETTSLTLSGQPLEVAAQLLDAQFEPVSYEFYWAFPPPRLPEQWSAPTLEFHRKTGIIEEFYADEFQPSGGIHAFNVALHEYLEGTSKLVLTGYSPHFDRQWLELLAPLRCGHHLSHQMLDISTLYLALQGAGRHDLADASWGDLGDIPHRALGDIRHELKHLQNYRDIFKGLK